MWGNQLYVDGLGHFGSRSLRECFLFQESMSTHRDMGLKATHVAHVKTKGLGATAQDKSKRIQKGTSLPSLEIGTSRDNGTPK